MPIKRDLRQIFQEQCAWLYWESSTGGQSWRPLETLKCERLNQYDFSAYELLRMFFIHWQ